MMSSEEEQRIDYCRKHNIHHLFELLATKVLVDRPENPFEYLRTLIASVEESERKKGSYDPTTIHYENAADDGDGEKELKRITLGTFGLNNAGKTTLLSALGGNVITDSTPTVGFTPTQFQTDDFDICMFDLGGAANFRGIWVHYFHDCHGIIFVLDSSADDATVAESLQVLKETLMHSYVVGKPVLVLCNKKDLPNSRREAVVPDGFIEDTLQEASPDVPLPPYRVVATCGIKEDEDVDSSVEWLLKTVSDDYDRLAARVKDDTRKVKEEKDRQRAERLAAIRAESEVS